MTKITLKSSLTIKGKVMTFLIICSLFISGTAFARNHWNRNFIQISYDKSEDSIKIQFIFLFFDYEFGPMGEHGYTDLYDIKYSIDGNQFERLLMLTTKDQLKRNTSWLTMKKKKFGEKILIQESIFPGNDKLWISGTFQNLEIDNTSSKVYLNIKWILPTDVDVKAIKVWGKWFVKGLNCIDNIDGEKYLITEIEPSNEAINTDTKQKNVNSSFIDRPDNRLNTVKVSTQNDDVLVNGAQPGDIIKIYTACGAEVNSTVTTDNVVKIHLPKNQIYIVNVGQARYKVAL